MLEPAYIELLDTNKELRKELADEIANNNITNKKLNALTRKLDTCYKTLTQHDSTILAHEDEIESLKSEIIILKLRLRKALQDVNQKEKHLLTREAQMQELEDKVDRLKQRIKELIDKKIPINNFDMAHPNPLRAILNARQALTDALARIHVYFDRRGIPMPGNIANRFDEATRASNAIIQHVNDARTQRERLDQMHAEALLDETKERRVWWLRAQRAERRNHDLMQEKIAQQLVYRRKARQFRQCQADKGLLEYNRNRLNDRYQKWKAKEFNSRQIIFNFQNNPVGNMATIQDVTISMGPLLAKVKPYEGQEAPDDYFNKISQILAYGDTLGVVGFNNAVKTNVLASKMAGRFIPPNPFNDGAGNAVNTSALFQQWLQDTYQTVMIGANRTSLKALNHEKFNITDSPETYEKRIKPYAQGILFADALPYLYDHLPNKLSIRMRMIGPADLDAFFQNLRTFWLECGGQVWEESEKPPIQQIPGLYGTPSSQALVLQKDSQAEHDFIVRLAKDLDYLGVATDLSVLGPHIYDELGKRLGRKTAHVRRSPFSELQVRNTNATKKAVRKVVQKTPVKQIVRLCSVCRKAGHTKLNCPEANSPGVKRIKKINYVYQDEVEVSENTEEEYIEYIVEEEDEAEEEENEDDDIEYVEEDDSESRNCYAVKKKWCEVEYL